MTKKDFWNVLEQNRTDKITRLVFSDWLEESGESFFAFGQRMQAENDWYPLEYSNYKFSWWDRDMVSEPNCFSDFPKGVIEKLNKGTAIALRKGSISGRYYRTIQEAEEDLAQALWKEFCAGEALV